MQRELSHSSAMPGRGPGLSSWSAYTALQRVAPTELIDRIVQALLGEGLTREEAERGAGRRVGAFTARVEAGVTWGEVVRPAAEHGLAAARSWATGARR